MKKLIATSIITLMAFVFYSGVFAESTFVTADKLTINDVQGFFRNNIDGKGFSNSMKVNEFIGIYQNGNEAMVYYRWSGVEGIRGSNVANALHADTCIKFNDGRWFCFIKNDQINVGSFLTK